MKQDLRIIKTQDSLRHALLLLLKTKPLETITIAEICRLAKINRGTFYAHYKDVHSLFKDYFEVIVSDFKTAYQKPYFITGFQIHKIKPEMIQIFHHVKKYQDFYQIIFDQRIPIMYYFLLFDTVRSFMKGSVDMNLLKTETNINLDYLISYQANAILGILIQWHRQEYKTPIKELNEQLLSILSIYSSFRNKI